jgi:8-amino-3,8-dideoxy-alpha-D-manno-octulosonate transaminase
MGAEERAAADEVVQSRSLFRHYGPAPLHKASALEAEVSRIVGTGHALAVSSGTAALKCALHALQLRPGDEVIVPACTFVATANAVVLAGGVPVFAEVDMGLGLDHAHLETRITHRTVGIIAVHLQGEVCGVDQIAEIARRRGLWLVEDAAQAFGCSLNGKMAGAFGNIGIFSLQAHKTVTCGEGGLLVTDDPVLAARARRFQDQGGERDGDAYPSWEHPQAGFGENHKITEIQAAVALAQCGRLETLRSRMQAVHADLSVGLGRLGVQLRVSRDPVGAIPYSLTMFAPDPDNRRRIFEALAEAGVPADAAYGEPIYTMAPFARWSRGEAVSGLPEFGLPPPQFESCPRTEQLLARMVRIPLSPLYRATEIQLIRAALACAIDKRAA